MPLPASTNLDNMFNAIVTVLKAVKDPNATSSALFLNSDDNTWNIYDGPKAEPAGTPAAIIIPADGEPSKFISNLQNERGYGFYIFVVMDTNLDNYAATRKNMRLITDLILDALDRSDMLNETADILKAATFKWIEEDSANGVNIVAPLQISAMKTVYAQ